jgi:hypothetical protein
VRDERHQHVTVPVARHAVDVRVGPEHQPVAHVVHDQPPEPELEPEPVPVRRRLGRPRARPEQPLEPDRHHQAEHEQRETERQADALDRLRQQVREHHGDRRQEREPAQHAERAPAARSQSNAGPDSNGKRGQYERERQGGAFLARNPRSTGAV